MTIICPACRQPIEPGGLAVPVVRIDADGNPVMDSLDFAHRLCPNTIPDVALMGEPASWRQWQ